LPNLAQDKTLAVTLEASADDINLAAIPGLAPLAVTGGAGG
jgi:hypothetical protein